jgi:SAM-dependent methyltransferase
MGKYRFLLKKVKNGYQNDAKILDLGCGKSKQAGAIGIDISPDTQADIVYDLSVFPYPFEDNQFDEILCYDIIEHLPDTVRVMEEIHRVAKPNAIVKIRVPHYACWWAYSDPTHKKVFSPFSFDHFLENKLFEHYTRVCFRLVSRKIDFHRVFKWTGLEFLANKFPFRYEQFFAFIFRPCNINFTLMVIKNSSHP